MSGYRSPSNRPRGAVTPGATAHDQLGVECSTSLPLADQAIPLALAARVMREAMRDKGYQATPIGTMVRRYMRWLRNEQGSTRATCRDYEAILARMSLTLADRQIVEVSKEDLRDVIDLWSERTPRTRAKVTSVIRSFWGWMEDEGHIALSPAAKIRRPKAERRVARALPSNARTRLLEAARHPRDRLGLYCLLGLGLRREELAGLQVHAFDAFDGWVIVDGKGAKERKLPVMGPMLSELRLYLAADLPHVGRPPEPDDYLLYPVDHRATGKGPEGQLRHRRTGRPKDRPSPQAVHRWYYRIAAAAGLVARGQTSGLNMHRARHLFALEVRRAAGLDIASSMLGHSDVSTTLGIYGHVDEDELRDGMSAYLAWLEGTDDGTENEV